jgi:hypothetical protein
MSGADKGNDIEQALMIGHVTDIGNIGDVLSAVDMYGNPQKEQDTVPNEMAATLEVASLCALELQQTQQYCRKEGVYRRKNQDRENKQCCKCNA